VTIGYDNTQLSAIDVELKEAVCDAVVNMVVNRVSGTDDEGRQILARSPERAVMSGQLLRRFDRSGDDETTDIHLSAIGTDFIVANDSSDELVVTPRFSVYLRVLPTWQDICSQEGGAQLGFRLNRAISATIEAEIKSLRDQAFKEQGVDQPDWKKLDESEASKVREKRRALQDKLRTDVYARHNITVTSTDFETDAPEAVGDQTPDSDNQPETDDKPQQPAISRMLIDGRNIPHGLIEPTTIPPKWQRLDLDLPRCRWKANLAGEDLSAHAAAYGRELVSVVTQQLDAWLAGEGQRTAWRNVSVVPGDVESEARWNQFLDRARAAPMVRDRLLPDLSGIILAIERQTDFLEPDRASIRVMIDNQSRELTGEKVKSVCNTIFGVGLQISVPDAAHRLLRLDRVEPSYRFRNFLEYPAIGLNCGIVSSVDGATRTIDTTWAPRFQQPRIVARESAIPCSFVELADPSFDVELLLALPKEYADWVAECRKELEPAVVANLPANEAAIEKARLQRDLDGQLAEARYIEKGVRLLAESQSAWRQLGVASGADAAKLARVAAPYQAWRMMNEAFADRDDRNPARRWRLFQVAFILAHVPTFASRMEEFKDQFDPLRDEEGASLLYFPTGGGKSEAFYGTLVFAILLDRLRGKDRGITAMIRYPLRLLTLQQAQRLLKLLVRVELVRRRHGVGAWPVEIGFWVGSANTPNRYSEFRSEIPRLADTNFPTDEALEEGAPGTEQEQALARRYREARDAYNKVPACPACGEPTGLRRNEAEGDTAKRAAIVCFNSGCDWNKAHEGFEPLPFLLTDDTIYQRAPAVVLGTVDKLAMLGQHTNTITNVLGMFGLARWIGPTGHFQSPRRSEDLEAGPRSENCRPVHPAYKDGKTVFLDPFPSLIIQDEAHLLEESLGTFSGLFDTLLETCFNEITDIAGKELQVARRWDGKAWGAPRMPKIIAATATISNPERQLEILYQRRPLRFPYPGPDIYRSFFAEPQAPPSRNPARTDLSEFMPRHLAPEFTSPWMRLYVSLMTNGATHTVTTVNVLAAFHLVITRLWNDMTGGRAAAAISLIRASISAGIDGDWRRAAIDRALEGRRETDVMALVDLHRIALAYVTNKKGGDQVIDALSTIVRQRHRAAGLPIDRFGCELISGGVDMKEIQRVMNEAEASFAGKPYPSIDDTLRNIVATSAISHGVDVDRFNSMFFAGLPSDVAEYIQASSRVGRTHVGFVMLMPTPQSRRDRYVVETHDIFHRFLERMIAPPAVERWAEHAIKRTLASLVQTWAMLKEARGIVRADDDAKERAPTYDMVTRFKNLASRDSVALADELGDFILRAIGFEGRSADHIGAPPYQGYYRGIVLNAAQDFADAMIQQRTASTLAEYWKDLGPVFKKPMTSLRDVDEAGYITASAYDPGSQETSKRVDRQDIAEVMRVIRSQKGDAAETDADGGMDD
jgi:hypothetical protein